MIRSIRTQHHGDVTIKRLYLPFLLGIIRLLEGVGGSKGSLRVLVALADTLYAVLG